MPQLRMMLRVDIVSNELQEYRRPEGPLFHRWIPDGENDAVCLTETHSPYQLRVWFERRMELRDNYLQWTGGPPWCDVDTMQRQGKIDAGTLFGELHIAEVQQEDLDALRSTASNQAVSAAESDNTNCVRLGKRVAKFLQPHLNRFIEALRDQYGQHWLRSIEPWNSEIESLGSYCSQLGLHWWDEGEGKWNRFVPTRHVATMTVVMDLEHYKQFLTYDDWQTLMKGGARKVLPLGAQLLARAARLLGMGEDRLAFVEAASAIEAAVSEKLRQSPSHLCSANIRSGTN